MKISFENFGVIDKGEIEQKPLTILCGENNTGKTYAMYAMYGSTIRSPFYPVIDSLKTIINIPLNEGQRAEFSIEELLKHAVPTYKTKRWFSLNDRLSEIFNSSVDKFQKSEVNVWLNFEDRLSAIFNEYISIEYNNMYINKPIHSYIFQVSFKDNKTNPYLEHHMLVFYLLSDLIKNKRHNNIILPAERGALNLFYQELNAYRTNLLHHLRSPSENQFNYISKYPLPLASYIDMLNSMPAYIANRSEGEFRYLCDYLGTHIIKGGYSIDETNSINFHPNNQESKLPLHLVSSTVKTYFGLWFYLQHIAQEGDVLMIDEPELSLHPSNQRKIARLLAQLVNKGIKVVISTHSDYMVREFNSLIMLGHAQDEKSKQELMAKYNYQEDELLTKDKVGAYLFHNNTIDSMEITEDEGIIATTFDEVINELNQSSDDIYYSLKR